jgi:hypothetical protein
MLTIGLGPGRRIEASIGNARFAKVTSKLGSSLIPLRVEGVNRNVLLDEDGKFYDRDRLVGILDRGEKSTKSAKEIDLSNLDSKEKRVEYFKQSHQKRRVGKGKQ